MNLERLRAVQAEEREADSLRALPDSFYREVADYVEELRGERARAAESADDPFGSAEVRRLTDEIETAEEVAEAIYERRVGKLVKRASLAAAGVPADEEGLTAEEAELFSTLVDQIEAHREDVLAAFDGERDGTGSAELAEGETGLAPDRTDDPTASGPDPERSYETHGGDVGRAGGSGSGSDEGTGSGDGAADDGPPTPPDEPTSEGDLEGGEADSTDTDVADSAGAGAPGGHAGDEEAADAGDAERLTLRITRDVGEVFGVDERVYDLGAEDVVTLPAANAKPLIERDAAERLD